MPHREAKQIVVGDAARDGILAGSKQTYDAVRETFGPLSGNVAIEKVWGQPRITHDGVTVAREVLVEDSVQNIGAVLLAEASKQTNDTAGDGTSATVILGYTIHELSHRSVKSGRNAMMMKRGILKAGRDAKDVIDELAVDVNAKELAQIATISASGDKALGALIADTVHRVGAGVTIEEYNGLNVEQEIVEGFYFDRGFASPQLQPIITTEDESNPVCVLVLEKAVNKVSDIFPIMETMAKAKRTKLLIVAAASGHALNFAVSNVMQGNFEVCIVDSPIYGQQRIEFLMDVAAVTGAKVVPAGAKAPTLADLGKCDRVAVTSKSTTIVAGNGDPEVVIGRIEEINTQLKTEANEVIRKQMESRRAKLKGKIGIIRVGGATEVDMKETKDRVDDAVKASQAAQLEGMVAGGGTALVHVSSVLRDNLDDDATGLIHQDEIEGYRIVVEALKAPFTQLMLNSGQPADYNLKMVQKAGYGKGYNAELHTENPVNLFTAGVVDPALVIKMEVENATSVAAELVTTNVAITHLKLDKLEEIEEEL